MLSTKKSKSNYKLKNIKNKQKKYIFLFILLILR